METFKRILFVALGILALPILALALFSSKKEKALQAIKTIIDSAKAKDSVLKQDSDVLKQKAEAELELAKSLDKPSKAVGEDWNLKQ